MEWPVGQPVTKRRVLNAAEAASNGFELELAAKPLPRFNVFAGFGYTEGKFGNWVAKRPDGGSFDYDGKYLPNAPKYTFHVGAQYRLQNGIFMRADLLGTGDYYYDSENLKEIGGYATFNMRFGYEQEDYDIILWANNLFDERYLVSKVEFMGELVQDGLPRTVGLTLRYRF